MKYLICLAVIIWMLVAFSSTNRALKTTYDRGYIDGYIDGIKTKIEPLK